MNASQRIAGGLVLLTLWWGPVARAQDSEALARQGRAAYQALEYRTAAALFRRSLAVTGPEALLDSARADSYMYLGATELFRARRAAADSAFANALAADPQYRPDPLIFPPEVTDVFNAVRYDSRFVKAVAPNDTTIAVGDPAYIVRLYASARHEIGVDLMYENGRVAQSLYRGTIGDSLTVRWDGRTEPDREPVDELLVLQITSVADGKAGRIVQLPLSVRAIKRDTLVPPPPPNDADVLRERSSSGPAFRALAVGVVGGLAAIALPALAAEAPTGPERFVLGASLGLSGLIGFVAQRPGRSLPRNIAVNQEERDEWQRAVDEVHAENRRRQRTRLHISSERPRIIDEETP